MPAFSARARAHAATRHGRRFLTQKWGGGGASEYRGHQGDKGEFGGVGYGGCMLWWVGGKVSWCGWGAQWWVMVRFE